MLPGEQPTACNTHTSADRGVIARMTLPQWMGLMAHGHTYKCGNLLRYSADSIS